MSAFIFSAAHIRRASTSLILAMAVAGSTLVKKSAQAAEPFPLDLPALHYTFTFLSQEICHKPERREAELATLVRMVRSLESHQAKGDGICYKPDGTLVKGPETYLGYAFGSGQIMPPTFTKLSMDLITDGSPYKDIYKDDPRFNPEIGNPLLNAEVALWTKFAHLDKKHEEKIYREIPRPAGFRGADGHALKYTNGVLITSEQEALKHDAAATPIYVGLALRDVATITIEEIERAPTLRKVAVSQLKNEVLYEQVVDGSIRADQRRLEKFLGYTPSFEQRILQAARWWLGGKTPDDNGTVKSDGNVNDRGYVAFLNKALANLSNPQIDAHAGTMTLSSNAFVKALHTHFGGTAFAAAPKVTANKAPPEKRPEPPARPSTPWGIVLHWPGY